MDAHLLARTVRIAFNDRIYDTGVFLLQMEVIVLWAGSRFCALQFTAGDDAGSDQAQKFGKTLILRGFCDLEVKVKIRVTC